MGRTEQPEWLQSFIAVAEQKSFSAAAQMVHRSQSRVSAHVGLLERSLGTPLFDRRYRPIRLTEAGHTYLEYARTVVSALAQGADAVGGLDGPIRGLVVIGSYPSPSAALLVPVMAELAKTYPEIRIEITEGVTFTLLDKLLSGSVELLIRNSWPEEPEPPLMHRPLWKEDFVAVVPEGHELEQLEEPLDPECLKSYPLISIGRPGKHAEPEISQLLQQWEVDIGITLHSEHPQTLMTMVRTGLGVGLINRLAFNVAESSGLVARSIGQHNEARVVSVWWDQDRYTSAATRVVLQALREAPLPQETVDLRETWHS